MAAHFTKNRFSFIVFNFHTHFTRLSEQTKLQWNVCLFVYCSAPTALYDTCDSTLLQCFIHLMFSATLPSSEETASVVSGNGLKMWEI